MAFFRRDKSGRAIVEYWDPSQSKKRKVPRSQIRFLDTLPDEDGKAWADRWQQEHGPKVLRALENHLSEQDEAKVLFEIFLRSYAAVKGTSDTTLEDERGRFYNHIVPIIVGDFHKKDVRQWSTMLPALTTKLLAKGKLAPEQINKCLGLLRRFSRNLKITGVLASCWDVEYVQVPKRAMALISSVTPEQVLIFVRNQTDIRVKLIALLAFFSSIRPEEIFPLAKEDFLTGALAIEKSPTYERFQKIGLGSKLTIHVRRSMDRRSRVKEYTKKENLQRRSAVMLKAADIDSTGEYITVWHEEGARELAKILKELPGGRLFKVGRKRLFEI